MPQGENAGRPAEASRGQEPIFALDIGTHSVIGVVGQAEEGLFRVLDICQMEYPHKAMRDGQIEDIDQVAATAAQVRSRLQESLQLQLQEVEVAAAGRSLRTQQATFELELPGQEPIATSQVDDLEMCAIQQAEQAMLEENELQEIPYYYVGHSVTRYYLDGYPIASLLDHRGKKIRADIIATFLPAQVLESLQEAMRKAGLAVNSITLEPIAAMNAIIPQELRLLNLALVDIGAGTSDVAISQGGSVAAYTMATTAGDEITEAVAQSYLVDLGMAERMKLSLSQGVEEIPYQDVLGISYTTTPQELEERIRPMVEELCEDIASHILAANGKPPAAVFLVGGGSKLPGLAQRVADRLQMQPSKVAVGGSNYMKRMVSSHLAVDGPEFATPMGIALTAAALRSSQRYTVTLNGRAVQLSARRQASVMDLLLQCGYSQGQLLGRAGRGVAFELDGEKRVVRGGHPTAAAITVGGKPASILTPVRPGDAVEIVPALPGSDAAPRVSDVVEGYCVFPVMVDGQACQAGTLVHSGGVPVPGEHRIREGEVLEVWPVQSVGDLARRLQLGDGGNVLWMDGRPAPLRQLLRPGDVFRTAPAGQAPAPDEGDAGSPGRGICVNINGRSVDLAPKEGGAPYQFVEMLNFVEIDPSQPQGNVVLTLNGRSASYLDVVADGDQVQIGWERANQ